MRRHITPDEMDGFCAGTLPAKEVFACDAHMKACATCREMFDSFKLSGKYSRPTICDFSPESYLREEHLEGGDAKSYLDGEMDDEEAELVEAHLELCGRCRAAVRHYTEFRAGIEEELAIRVGPRSTWDRARALRPWRRVPPSSAPAYAALLIMLSASVALLVTFFGPAPRQAPEHLSTSPADAPADTTPTGTPDQTVVANPRPGTATADGGVEEKEEPPAPTKSGVDVASGLNDGGRPVGFDVRGRLVGLDGLPDALRKEIAAAIRSARVPVETLDELESAAVVRRGVANEEKIVLRSPVGMVISQDAPTLSWKPLPGATYVVTVVGPDFRPVKSPELSTPHWRVSAPLRRGEVYRWQVTAFRDGQEIENTSTAIGKFKIISEAALRRLERARKTHSSHLALGVLYAREGMRREAAREFQLLSEENPRSELARRLFNSVRMKSDR